MARHTKQAQIEALRCENEQLRAQLSAAVQEQAEAMHTACEAREQLLAVRAQRMPATSVVTINQLARAFCEVNGVRSCTREQAMSMAGGVQ